MQTVHGVLGDAQDAALRQVEVHLRGSLAVGDQLEDELHSVDLLHLPVAVTS